jgi:hypothetical protein
VLLIAAPVCVLRTLSDKWQCEVIGPDGDHFHVPAGLLSEGTRRCSDLRETDSPWDQRGAGISAPDRPALPRLIARSTMPWPRARPAGPESVHTPKPLAPPRDPHRESVASSDPFTRSS